MSVIKPTVGRVVLYHPAGDNLGPARAAIVTAVWGDRCVNLAVFEQNGVPMSHPPTSVTLVQPGDPVPTAGRYCRWMDYQIEQAKKHEQAELLAAAGT